MQQKLKEVPGAVTSTCAAVAVEIIFISLKMWWQRALATLCVIHTLHTERPDSPLQKKKRSLSHFCKHPHKQ